MEYPYRIKVMFGPKTSKLNVIQYINHFMVHDCKGKYEKWNINQRIGTGYMSEFAGIEIGFKHNVDAVHFKLGFSSDSEEIIAQNLSQ